MLSRSVKGCNNVVITPPLPYRVYLIHLLFVYTLCNTFPIIPQIVETIPATLYNDIVIHCVYTVWHGVCNTIFKHT